MAITIHQNPDINTPAYNPIWFVVSSTNVAQANFRYVCDVYIKDITPAYFRIEVPPNPDNNNGIFDIHKIIESYISTSGTIDLDNHGFYFNTFLSRQYICHFGEKYGATGSVVVYPDLAISTARFAWNSFFDLFDFKTFNDSTFLVGGGAASPRYLTNAVSPLKITTAENAWLKYLVNTNLKLSKADIKTYDSAGALIQNIRVQNNFSTVSGYDERHIQRFSSGANNLNLIPSGDIVLGAQPIITAAVSYYTIQMLDDVNVAQTETFRYNIISYCGKYTPVRLHFLNKPGGMDPFTFSLSNKKTINVRRQYYRKALGKNLTSASWGFQIRDRSEIPFYTEVDELWNLNSDWITETEVIWLEELITSPEIYMDDSTYGLVAVSITSPASYEHRKHVSDKRINMQVQIKTSLPKYRQRA